MDGRDGYAQSVWSGSAQGRWPLAYPGRGTLASAVLTSVLDCAKPLGGAKAALQRRYPQEAIAFAKQTVAVPLLTTDEAEIFDVFDHRFFRKDNPFLRRGRFELKTAEDPVKGSCVEIRDLLGTKETLKTQENCTTINFPRSQSVSGEYDTIGVWVEGNMGGGRVWFEFTDAEGEVWATTGSGGYGCGSYDRGGQMSVNFDGWHFLKFPIAVSSPVKIPAVGADFWQVTRDGHGNGRIDYPIKVTGMAFSNRPWNLDFLEMRPYVRFKDVTLLKVSDDAGRCWKIDFNGLILYNTSIKS